MNQLSVDAFKSELNRLQGRPLSKYIDGLTRGLEERISTLALSDSAKRWPCRLCNGAGFIVMAGSMFSVDVDKKTLEPVRKKNGGEIRTAIAETCPRCLGVQFDLEAMCEERAKGGRV